jgi:hypothetical protein
MSFGLIGAPHTFQKAVKSTLALCVGIFYAILIYSQSLEDHVVHLEQVL